MKNLALSFSLFTLSLTSSLALAGGKALYTMDNSPAGNNILIFERSNTGALSPSGMIATGGLGTGGPLGNQGGLVLSEDGKWLLAVNAGSHDISVFAVRKNHLRLADRVESGGLSPISIALHRDVVYVLNAGGGAGDQDNITGFLLSRRGQLWPCPGSTQPLSDGNTGPAQIGFDPRGGFLVVTEKGTSVIDLYEVDKEGLPISHEMFPSQGITPFGFAFGKRGQLLVSEAFEGGPDASAVSSYDLGKHGGLEISDPSVATTETAACWVVVTGNGRFAYTSNTGSGSISGFDVGKHGELELLDPDGQTGLTGMGSNPIDLALSRDNRYLYSLNSGTDSISVFLVGSKGQLRHLSDVKGLPSGANGLAAE